MKKQIGSALALYPPGGVAPWWTASPMVYGPAIAAIRPKHLQRHKPRRGPSCFIFRPGQHDHRAERDGRPHRPGAGPRSLPNEQLGLRQTGQYAERRGVGGGTYDGSERKQPGGHRCLFQPGRDTAPPRPLQPHNYDKGHGWPRSGDGGDLHL